MIDEEQQEMFDSYYMAGYPSRRSESKMTKPDRMQELEEKVNNAAKECSDRLWNKKWDLGQDMLKAAFIEGVKWLARESMKEQTNG